jgi:glyoxalase family protein
MDNRILGLHHVTAIAGNARRNLDFYTRLLGLRFIKKTVNFDDPHTYHFYYGDYHGSPGTILTFFPWEGAANGRRGTGQATEVGFSVPAGSLDFWLSRFKDHNIIYNKPATKFEEEYLTVLDPDGLKLELVVSSKPDARTGYTTDQITEKQALKGFHHVTLTLGSIKPTADVLTGIFGYKLISEHVNRYRFATGAVEGAAIIDLVEAAGESSGQVAVGSVHHIAFRVKDDAAEMKLREIIENKGFQITPPIDRNYFHSLYFREPGGVLFEIATDNPGFTADESLEDLGRKLKLPPQYEPRRQEIEQALPPLS